MISKFALWFLVLISQALGCTACFCALFLEEPPSMLGLSILFLIGTIASLLRCAHIVE